MVVHIDVNVLYEQKEPLNNLRGDVLITCSSVWPIDLSMCSETRGCGSCVCLRVAVVKTHEGSLHAMFPFFNGGTGFKDESGPFAPLLYATAFS